MTTASLARPRSIARFLLKLTLYALPFAIPFLVLCGFMVYTGESMPLRMVAQMQLSDQPVLYRPRYGNRDLEFKTLSANLRQPDILAAGSSRILQFRAQFFNLQPREFYNTGAPAWTLDQVQEMLNGLTYTPRILILAIDQSWFNDAVVPETFAPQVSDFQHLFMANRSFMQEIVDGTIGREDFDIGRYLARVEPERGGLALGLRAIRDGHGFRNDGSEQYGDFLVAHWLYPQNERQRHLDWLRDGKEMYAYGDTVSASRLQQLEEVLTWCEARGITVIGFLPPFMPTLYQQITTDGNHTYLDALYPTLAALFTRYDFPLFDFSGEAALGATDEDFFDGWHASERINLRLYARMYATLYPMKPGLLDAYTDLASLQAADDNATNTFEVFGDRTTP
jgi:hypothetical protein